MLQTIPTLSVRVHELLHIGRVYATVSLKRRNEEPHSTSSVEHTDLCSTGDVPSAIIVCVVSRTPTTLQQRRRILRHHAQRLRRVRKRMLQRRGLQLPAVHGETRIRSAERRCKARK